MENFKKILISNITVIHPECLYYDEEFEANEYLMQMAVHWKKLPPIKLVKINDQYILLDGHHRLSTAIYLGKKSIKYYLRKEDD